MNETKLEGSTPKMGMGNGSTKITVAAIFGAVLITLILAGCFLTTLIMILDFIPFQHIVR